MASGSAGVHHLNIGTFARIPALRDNHHAAQPRASGMPRRFCIVPDSWSVAALASAQPLVWHTVTLQLQTGPYANGCAEAIRYSRTFQVLTKASQ